VYDNAIYAVCASRRFFKTTPELNLQTSLEKLGDQLPSRKFQLSKHQELSNRILNAVVAFATETARAGYVALIFCSCRAGYESDAILISQVMPESSKLPDEVLESRKDLLNEPRSMPTGVDYILERTIPRGEAFHRSVPFQHKPLTNWGTLIADCANVGLTTEERERVAEGYDQGMLKIVVATCSLAAGINLPARRVILHDARMGRDLVGPAML
jgi:replicative superfamily II helicase